MSEDLAKLKVTIEGDSKSFKREMSQSEAEAKKACNAIKKAMNNITELIIYQHINRMIFE